MRKAIRIYVLATQLILTLALMGVIGIFVGKKYYSDNSMMTPILAGVGLIVGLFLDILFIFQFLRNEARHEKTT